MIRGQLPTRKTYARQEKQTPPSHFPHNLTTPTLGSPNKKHATTTTTKPCSLAKRKLLLPLPLLPEPKPNKSFSPCSSTPRITDFKDPHLLRCSRRETLLFSMLSLSAQMSQ